MSDKKTIVIMDRYSATGTPRPGPDACTTCEGMGYHPTKCTCGGALEHHTHDADDLKGWCWVKPCQTCKGSRKQPN